MPYKAILGDVRNYEGDVIVNSIGVYGNVYGYLCKNILNAIDDNNIRQIIDNSHNKYNDVIETGGGKLKCKKVFHVCTPTKYNGNVMNLLETYQMLINAAIGKGYKSIALPLIGCGANGFTNDEAFEAANIASSIIVDREEELGHDLIDITIITYVEKARTSYHRHKEGAHNEILSNMAPMPKKNNEYEEDFCYQYKLFNQLEEKSRKEIVNDKKYDFVNSDTIFDDITEFLASYDEDEEIEILDETGCKYDFIESFFKSKNVNDRIIVSRGINKSDKDRLKNKGNNITELYARRFIIACGMSKNEAIQFMIYCGYMFKPNSLTDKILLNYLNGKYKDPIYDLLKFDNLQEKVKAKCYDTNGFYYLHDYSE